VCLYSFTPQPQQFQGWGIFQPVDEQTAMLLEAADPPQIEAYLQQFPTIWLRLAYCLQHQTWLAYPSSWWLDLLDLNHEDTKITKILLRVLCAFVLPSPPAAVSVTIPVVVGE
jgi:hypothetical protein